MHKKAKEYINKLKLIPHPEGGYFREVYRSGEIIEVNHLPKRYKSSRTFSTSIYFLLEGKQISLFHKLQSDETWHFYDGCAAKIYILNNNGNLHEIILSKNLEEGKFQYTISKNNWFAAEVFDKNSFCLVGYTVSPGFDFSDFELGDREVLLKKFPKHKKIIEKFTK